MPNFLLKPFAHGIVMWKILSAATAAIPIKLNPIDKPYLSGTLCEIDKAIKATARTITKTKLTDKVNSEIVLHKAGLRCLTEAVSELMACEIWKGRNNMNPLAGIFERKPHVKSTCSASSDKLHHPVPGYPQVLQQTSLLRYGTLQISVLLKHWGVQEPQSVNGLGKTQNHLSSSLILVINLFPYSCSHFSTIQTDVTTNRFLFITSVTSYSINKFGSTITSALSFTHEGSFCQCFRTTAQKSWILNQFACFRLSCKFCALL